MYCRGREQFRSEVALQFEQQASCGASEGGSIDCLSDRSTHSRCCLLSADAPLPLRRGTCRMQLRSQRGVVVSPATVKARALARRHMRSGTLIPSSSKPRLGELPRMRRRTESRVE